MSTRIHLQQVKVELIKVTSRITDTANTSEGPPQRIITNELANIPATTMTNLPRSVNLGRTARHQRTKDTNYLIQKHELRFLCCPLSTSCRKMGSSFYSLTVAMATTIEF